ncbi:oligoribonuclease [Alkalilimnicola ehrlichii MLHE-1]|uniref:Oligoribonuclease n=1 Tax=Alkalilimnicola ehrlichii (strain ATCC BAA-1101 / DSM 17681 / MLHE-1) TaxID=187272 RepID=ORN_ALKEH|nr:oligoribonuclease [Alkalilimnicola ehrlichii]Q0A8I6.1 RecName: Full=Oligoribonuclease [Alkalilimnicola ehrlichii MLHE-1]ABI56851.1 Exonuclease, RNase T and DNA polymerase III [Alkalilimnicola ehrlichii MLHE-1]
MGFSEHNLVWLDLEMTGLDPDTDRIIEIATLVTDSQLNILAEGPVLAVRQSEQALAAMDEWNTRTHGESGLIERVRASHLDEAAAEAETLAFLRRWVPERASPMCGNSICQDRRFLYRYMPRLEAWFHYRNLDVSTLKLLANRWHPEVLQGFSKKATHQALEDIRESVAELRHYRAHFLRLPAAGAEGGGAAD